MLYTTNMLLEKYADYTSPFDKIRRECNNGNLIKIVRGLYEDDASTPAFLLAQYIYGPSYISFEYVLSSSGLIPEYACTVTSATFRKNRSKTYTTPFGSFMYHDVPSEVFQRGAEYHVENGYVYLIATPERALCDELYICPQAKTKTEFESLLFEDLRINIDMLYELDIDAIKETAPLYRRRNLEYLVEHCERGRQR